MKKIKKTKKIKPHRRLIDDIILSLKVVPFIFIILLICFAWILPAWEKFLDDFIPKSPTQLKLNALEEEKEETLDRLNDINVGLTTRDGQIAKLQTSNQKMMESNNERIKLDYSQLPNAKIYIANLIIREWERHGGTDDLVPLTICMYESQYNPLTRNTNGENSWGLFQVNVGDPAHANRMQYTDYARLYEPLFNIRYQFPELVRYEKQGIAKGLQGSELAQYVARYGQRPKWTSALANQIDTYYNQFKNAVIGGGI